MYSKEIEDDYEIVRKYWELVESGRRRGWFDGECQPVFDPNTRELYSDIIKKAAKATVA